MSFHKERSTYVRTFKDSDIRDDSNPRGLFSSCISSILVGNGMVLMGDIQKSRQLI